MKNIPDDEHHDMFNMDRPSEIKLNNNIKTDPDDIIIVGLPDVEEVHVFGVDDPSY